MKTAVVAAIVLVASLPAPAQEGTLIHNGFITAQQFMRASESMQRGYVMGYIDATFISPLLGSPKARVVPIENCVEGMNDEQLVAMFLKYLRNNPERWHQSAHAAFYATILDACGIKNK